MTEKIREYVPWYEVLYIVNEGTYAEFACTSPLLSNSAEAAIKIFQEKYPEVRIVAAYEK